jgi:uncharacterized protein YbjT (DUF2867 family)
MILVTGATGNVGGALVHALLEDGRRVRALGRSGTQAPPGAEAIDGDLDQPATLAAALEGVRGAFLLSGFKDMPGVMVELDRAGVDHVALLSSGAVEDGEKSNAVTRYNMEAEDAVRNSGVGWTILRPSGFMANALRWLPQLREGDVVRAPWADVAVAAIDPMDIAAVAARALTSPGHEGKTYRLTGPEPLVPADQVRVLGDVLGRDLRFEAQPDDEARAEMSSAMPADYVEAFFRYFSEGTYDDSKVLPTVRDLLGREPRTFEQWATAHAGDFR